MIKAYLVNKKTCCCGKAEVIGIYFNHNNAITFMQEYKQEYSHFNEDSNYDYYITEKEVNDVD